MSHCVCVCVRVTVCVCVCPHVDPAQSEQVVMVLEAEELLHVLHVTVVRPGRLFRHHHVRQHKLIMVLDGEREGGSCDVDVG